MFVASTLDQFHQRFTDGLAAMLAPDELGAYILVLANSLQSPSLRANLAYPLAQNFEQLQQALKASTLIATQDDVDVFRQLQAIDPENLEVNCRLAVDGWILQSNAMRALRPPRASLDVITALRQTFDNNKFNFNKSFLKPEILWEDTWQGAALRVLYNKFPLAPYHLLVVPDPQLAHEQFLTREYHELASRLVTQQQAVLPGLYLGYNSLGACASVNHLHFHAVLREGHFPVESDNWQHHGGVHAYPSPLKLFDSADASWGEIERLHAAAQAYNLLYTAQGIYVLPRQFQNTVEVPEIMKGAGWTEMCGEVTVSSAQQLERSLAGNIPLGLEQLGVSLP